MKSLLDQILYEGLGSVVYVPIKKKIDKKNINPKYKKILNTIIKILFITTSVLFALGLLYFQLPIK